MDYPNSAQCQQTSAGLCRNSDLFTACHLKEKKKGFNTFLSEEANKRRNIGARKDWLNDQLLKHFFTTEKCTISFSPRFQVQSWTVTFSQ